ncbi:hypothetical protein ACE38W_06055 [Chitinophaga sp. Hz27]|uniref:hypothetical protein n=1 Tax=Chitinophaga sp. Hz27 TaxID=3347169 RepID=UPI0035DB3707
MIPSIRKAYNASFSDAKYRQFLDAIAEEAGIAPSFRVAETPVFVPADLTAKLVQACEEVVNVILRPDFKDITESSIPHGLRVPNENDHPHFIVIDFAVTKNEAGILEPQLIELQGFPTMFAFQHVMAKQFRANFNIPAHLNNYFNDLDDEQYYDLLRKMIIGEHQPEEVILLEVKPEEQKTKIDFYITEKYLGIHPVCITKLIKEGEHLFYMRDGVLTPVKRIYNRIIFDDLKQQEEILGPHVDLFDDLDVEWITHPNWFYRISKYTMPLLHSEFIPKSWYLNELPVVPADLENYVLKPLFSFAGKGVKIDVTREDIDAIEDPENWILQRKVQYAPAIETPTGPAICEIRMMYIWPDDAARPILVHNLSRLSKGKMIGVGFNSSDTWVGGSCCFFESLPA